MALNWLIFVWPYNQPSRKIALFKTILIMHFMNLEQISTNWHKRNDDINIQLGLRIDLF